MTVSCSARDLEDFLQELPAPVDRLALEVVPEAEVSQHLEERFMERGAADVFDVAGADALLARGRTCELRVAKSRGTRA